MSVSPYKKATGRCGFRGFGTFRERSVDFEIVGRFSGRSRQSTCFPASGGGSRCFAPAVREWQHCSLGWSGRTSSPPEGASPRRRMAASMKKEAGWLRKALHRLTSTSMRWPRVNRPISQAFGLNLRKRPNGATASCLAAAPLEQPSV